MRNRIPAGNNREATMSFLRSLPVSRKRESFQSDLYRVSYENGGYQKSSYAFVKHIESVDLQGATAMPDSLQTQ